MQNKIVRLFISSTFADFRAERAALHERVFPALEAHCRARGARFDVVDLRWGISPDAQEDLQTLRICLEEVERCRAIGVAPHFVALLGDRYGWEPPPIAIEAGLWRAMMKRSGPDRALLKAFYRPDRNAVPVRWVLRRGAHGHADEAARRALVDAARRLALASGCAPEDCPELFAAATHQEILHGLLRPGGGEPGFAYLRAISGLPLSPAGAPYVDVAEGAFDADAHARLCALKALVREALPGERVRDIEASWAGQDMDCGHIDGFCAQFLADHLSLIDRSLADMDEALDASQAHEAFAQERARLFVGRRAPLAEILRYAAPKGSTPRHGQSPLVIEGAGGTGKSALLSKAALSLRAEAFGPVIVRFVGAAPGSEELASLLNDLAHEIARTQGRPTPQPGASLQDAVAAFKSALATSADDQTLTLIIDALDQLSPADQLHLLDWIPDPLPAHVRVIVSTRPGPITEEARRRYPRKPLRLSTMPAGELGAMLDRMLADAGRRLTHRQRNRIRRASPGSPLWMRLAFEEARQWRSDEPGRPLEGTIDGLIRARLSALAAPANHGTALVHEALGALAAARFGLSDSELAQALSQTRAPTVWAEFKARSFHDWDQPVLPAIVWLRLRSDLAAYLVEQRVDGALTYRFFHREFAEAARALALPGDKAQAMHARLADVFAEPAHAGLYRSCDASGRQDSRALRRVMEQPWQLAAAGRRDALAALLSSVEFVLAKCAANRAADLMQDISRLGPPAGDAAQAARETAQWLGRLRAWRASLDQADAQWPAHRILVQLLLEADPETATQQHALRALLQQAPPNWPVLTSASPTRYRAAPVADLPGVAGMAGLSALGERFIGVWDEKGGLHILDRHSAALVERVELGSPDAARTHMTRASATFGAPQTVYDRCDPDATGQKESLAVAEHGFSLSWRWDGCLVVTRPTGRSEIILGKGEIRLLGETQADCYFLCDERIFIAAKAVLGGLPPGLYAYGGLCIEGLALDGDDGGWTHQRFNSVVFIAPDLCLTLGFSGRGGQRDDVILEMYAVRADGVSRIAYGLTDSDLDLPIWHICGLTDGSIILASEHYWRTFIWSPPFEGEGMVEMIAGAWVGAGAHGSWVDPGDRDGALAFRPAENGVEVAFDAPGFYGSEFGAYHACDGVAQIEPDDHSAAGAFDGFETVTPAGVMARWHSDVRPHWVFEREQGDFVVFKNSGPVRVALWRGEDPGHT